jgi:serine protease AprX
MKQFGRAPKRLCDLRRTFGAIVFVLLGLASNALAAPAPQARVDDELAFRSAHNDASSRNTRAIVMLRRGAELPDEFDAYAIRSLKIIDGYVVDVPNAVLARLAAHPSILSIHFDRAATKFDYRTSITVGSLAVNQAAGVTGAGIGVAVIDSGITSWHDDLSSSSETQYPFGNQRVAAFVDFVGGATTPYDDNGHGSHVAGIIAGNGYDSYGQKAGVAPDADLVSLKVLDADGKGNISNVIAALQWVLENRKKYNIRVVNLSVGAAVHESYLTDPLTLAAKQVVDAGVVVVSAAGNLGKNAEGLAQYGGINAPGNAPWVLTVGASTTNGTVTRADDTIAGFSSRGPTYIDWAAKPDLVAPGVGTVSLADAYSTFYSSKSPYLLPGAMLTAWQPYLSLSGTSMAAPVVAGTVALMLQANPGLTPNAVKAILQYTSEVADGLNPLTQGAGFLNSLGAVRLARFYATAKTVARYPVQSMWSKRLIWGNHLLTGGVLLPTGNAWALGTTWGVAKTSSGDNIVWGTQSSGDNIVWGTARGDNIVWGTSVGDNIVWGTSVGDNIVWGTATGDNIVWGTSVGDNIVWGTSAEGDNIVWGTSAEGDNIVWGTSAGDNIVWGTDCGGADCGGNIVWGTAAEGDNIVWGTAAEGDNIVWGTYTGDNIVWGTYTGDNIVWGTVAEGDNIVWGTAAEGDNIVWGTSAEGDNIVWGTVDSTELSWVAPAEGTPVLVGHVNTLTDEQVFAVLSHGPTPVTPPIIVEPTAADPPPPPDPPDPPADSTVDSEPTADPAPSEPTDPTPTESTADLAPATEDAAPPADPAAIEPPQTAPAPPTEPPPTSDEVPVPTVDPMSTPEAEPAPEEPAPTPDPAPASDPAPAPTPEAAPAPEPTPAPTPDPAPVSEPPPAPTPEPVPAPAPESTPAPDPAPAAPEPAPAPEASAAPEAAAEPSPEPVAPSPDAPATPTPNPVDPAGHDGGL